MNIHVNKEEFDWLINQPRVGMFKMGSHLYGLNDENSDHDYLVILYPFSSSLFSPFANHHQFQYKCIESNTDYNFVDIVTFIKNLVSGDATVNFELLYSQEFVDNPNIGWLTQYREHFNTYTIIKAYLGFADRDIRHLNRKVGRDRISGMIHILRGIRFAKRLMYGTFRLDVSEMKSYKDELRLRDFIKVISDHKEHIKTIRQDDLNPRLERKEIPRFLDPKIQLEINDKLNNQLRRHVLGSMYGWANLLLSLQEKMFQANENPEIRYD